MPHGGATNASHHFVRRWCPLPTGRTEQPPPPDRPVPDETSTAGTAHGAMSNPGTTPRANMEQTPETNRPKPTREYQTKIRYSQVNIGGAGGTRTRDRWIMSPLL
jgi:hypothetical protein